MPGACPGGMLGAAILCDGLGKAVVVVALDVLPVGLVRGLRAAYV